MISSNNIIVKGKPIDDQTRCAHYHSSLDVIAVKFKCCNEYYPCYYCHKESSDHPADTWKKNEQNNKSIMK